MTLTSQIRSRVLTRARQALGPVGRWPEAKRLLDVSGIVAHLQWSVPGDLRDYEIDHKRALATFDMTVDRDVRQAFEPRNHQWMRKGVNQSKGARIR